jgi:hypothetical protein
VANKENPERAAAIVWQTQKLRKIVARIENELESESAGGTVLFAFHKQSPRPLMHELVFPSHPNPER